MECYQFAADLLWPQGVFKARHVQFALIGTNWTIKQNSPWILFSSWFANFKLQRECRRQPPKNQLSSTEVDPFYSAVFQVEDLPPLRSLPFREGSTSKATERTRLTFRVWTSCFRVPWLPALGGGAHVGREQFLLKGQLHMAFHPLFHGSWLWGTPPRQCAGSIIAHNVSMSTYVRHALGTMQKWHAPRLQGASSPFGGPNLPAVAMEGRKGGLATPANNLNIKAGLRQGQKGTGGWPRCQSCHRLCSPSCLATPDRWMQPFYTQVLWQVLGSLTWVLGLPLTELIGNRPGSSWKSWPGSSIRNAEQAVWLVPSHTHHFLTCRCHYWG